MPRRKNTTPQKHSPKLLKISNAKSREKHNLFKKAHNLFHSAFTKYQSGVNPKQKASSDLLAADNRAQHLATIATQRGNGDISHLKQVVLVIKKDKEKYSYYK